MVESGFSDLHLLYFDFQEEKKQVVKSPKSSFRHVPF